MRSPAAPDHPSRPAGATDRPRRVLLITASVGAGHDGPAREIARRLDETGHHATVVDLVDLVPWRSGPVLRRLFHWQLTLAPRRWGRLYDRLDRRGSRPTFADALIVAAGRRLAAIAAAHHTDLLVSTFPLGGSVVAASRPYGCLAPLTTYVTDPAAHSIWAHPTVSRYLVTTASTAADLWRCGPAEVAVVPPAVDPAFRPSRDSAEQAAVRAALGLPAGRLVVVTSGSWGVGDVARTARDLRRCGVTPLVVCGRNTRLRESLRHDDGIVVWGWTDRMAEVMRACDAVVLNSGGLTLMEAVATGTPVLHYRPLPGQGRANAAACERAGLAPWPRDETRLAATLVDVLGADARTARPAHIPARLLTALLDEPDPDTGVVAAPVRSAG